MSVWILYLIPGSEFGLALSDLNDAYIMGSVVEERVGLTVLLIAGRYILPTALLMWGMKWVAPGVFAVSMASVAVLPVIYAVGARVVVLMVWPGPTALPWEQFGRLVVLLIYLVVLLAGLVIAAAVPAPSRTDTQPGGSDDALLK